MKKVYIIVISTIILILIICGIEFLINNKNQEKQNVTNANRNVVLNENLIDTSSNDTLNQGDISTRSVDNVTMSIKDGTLTKTSATVVIVDKNDAKYNYSSWFRIDKKENEDWKEVKVINEKYAFNDLAYIPDGDGRIDMSINWENLYGELEAGEYRLVKEVYDTGKKYIYVEFTIE